MIDAYIHIDNYSAQTGVTRFLELKRSSGWIYDKTENLNATDQKMFEYTHLFIEVGNNPKSSLEPFKLTHQILYSIDGFNGVQIQFIWNKIPFPKFKVSKKINVLKKKQ